MSFYFVLSDIKLNY